MYVPRTLEDDERSDDGRQLDPLKGVIVRLKTKGALDFPKRLSFLHRFLLIGVFLNVAIH